MLSLSSTLSVGTTELKVDPIRFSEKHSEPIFIRFDRHMIEDHLQYHGWSRYGFGWAVYRDDTWMLSIDFKEGYRPPVHYAANIAAPDWFVVIVLSLLPIGWLVKQRKRKRAQPGGYPILCDTVDDRAGIPKSKTQ